MHAVPVFAQSTQFGATLPQPQAPSDPLEANITRVCSSAFAGNGTGQVHLTMYSLLVSSSLTEGKELPRTASCMQRKAAASCPRGNVELPMVSSCAIHLPLSLRAYL